MIHTLPLERRTLSGYFSKDVEPALRIADGDTVIFSTLDAGWKYHPTLGRWQPDFERHPQLDSGHALCGPVYVEGAQPGMTLEVQIGGWSRGARRRRGVRHSH